MNHYPISAPGIQKINLIGNLITGSTSHKELIKVYHEAQKFKGQRVELDLSDKGFIEGNLSAFILAIAYKLKRDNDVTLCLSDNISSNKTEIFNRNGLFSKMKLGLDAKCPVDYRQSTVPVAAFRFDDADAFPNYIKNDLLGHRGLTGIELNDKERVESSYYELFDNAGFHGTEEHPIFTCGQYFPGNKELKFSMVDLGKGFLANIKTHTSGKIKTHEEAIRWALKEQHSTKEIGGDGLPTILKYCFDNNGIIHIASGDCYIKVNKGKIVASKLPQIIEGTTINLTFRCE